MNHRSTDSLSHSHSPRSACSPRRAPATVPHRAPRRAATPSAHLTGLIAAALLGTLAATSCASTRSAAEQPLAPESLSAQTVQGTEPNTSEAELPDFQYSLAAKVRVGPYDVLYVTVFNQSALTGEFVVAGDGTILLPLVGNVQAAGKTPEELSTHLRERLADGYFVNPDVTVILKKQEAQKVFVIGEVTNSGVFTYRPGMTIIEAMGLAGGGRENAALNDTSITRVVRGKRKRYRVFVEDIGRGRAPNVDLYAGDIVYVPRSFF